MLVSGCLSSWWIVTNSSQSIRVMGGVTGREVVISSSIVWTIHSGNGYIAIVNHSTLEIQPTICFDGIEIIVNATAQHTFDEDVNGANVAASICKNSNSIQINCKIRLIS